MHSLSVAVQTVMAYAKPMDSSRLRSCVGIMVACLAAGCARDTAVIVEVTRDVASTRPDIERLDFVVGISRTMTAGTRAPYLMDQGASLTDVDVAARDLSVEPYQLLLHDAVQSAEASVMVAVIGKTGGQIVAFGALDVPQKFIDGKVILREIVLTGEVPFVGPTGCLKWIDANGNEVMISSSTDQDCDGDLDDVDCNDEDPTIGPSQGERCGNGVDDDCDGMVDEEEDADGDQVTNCGGDCDDGNDMTFPGALEICDGEDNDCSGACDDGNLDVDGDGYNVCGGKVLGDGTCPLIGAQDCDDLDNNIHPDALEECNGIDDDCSGACDDGDAIDVDDDGYSTCGTNPLTGNCGLANNDALTDCDDTDGSVHPFADEICDGNDNDCDGARLELSPCYRLDEMIADVCRTGTRACDDDDSDGTAGYADACVPDADGTNPVPVPFCTAYESCEAMGAPDPYLCANETVSSSKLVCDLYHTGSVLCPERFHTLTPATTPTNCNWSIIGGTNQEHYVVGLDSGFGLQASAFVCMPDLVVASRLDLIPQFQEFFLQLDDNMGGAGEVWQVEINPVLVLGCPASPGLHCSAL